MAWDSKGIELNSGGKAEISWAEAKLWNVKQRNSCEKKCLEWQRHSIDWTATAMRGNE